MDHEDPTLDVEAALRDEEALAARQRSCRRGLLGVSAEGDPAPGRL
jgi:hypothetical protein